MAGKPTTMMPLQKLEKSCKKTNWVMTMIVRLLERTVAVSLMGNASGDGPAGDAGLVLDGEGTGWQVSIVPDLGSSVCNSSSVIAAISRSDKKVHDFY